MEGADIAEGYRAMIADYAVRMRWPEVRRFATEWLKTNPTEPLAHYWIAWSALQQGDLVTADLHAQSLGNGLQESGLTCLLWAEIHLARKQHQSALVAILRAITISPDTAAYHQVLCKVRLHQGKYARALEAIEAALRLDPQNANFRLMHGTVSRLASDDWKPESGRHEIEYLKGVLAADPRNPWILARIGSICASELHDYRSGVHFLRQSLEFDASNALVREQFAAAQRNLHTFYRVLHAPAVLLYTLRRPWQSLGPFDGASELLLLPVQLCALVLVLIGAVFNLAWTWLPAILYQRLIFAEACLWDSRYGWQRTLYRTLNRIPMLLRIAIWCVTTLSVWTVQLYLLIWYAPVVLVGILFGWFAAIVQMDLRKGALAASRPPTGNTVRLITRRSRR